MRIRSFIIGTVLLLATAMQAQNPVKVEYFLDKDPGYGQARSVNNIRAGSNQIEFDVSDAAPGVHLLSVRSQDSDGRWSTTMSRPLFIDRLQDIVYVEYYIDTDPGVGKATPLSLPDLKYKAHLDFSLDISTKGLALGKHELYVRAKDAFDQWTDVMSRSFTIITSGGEEPEEKGDLARMEYFFDSDPGYGKGFPLLKASTGENTYEISFESLSSGYHLLSLRAQDEKGRWSSVVSRPIFVANPQKVVAMEYFIDNDPGEGKAIAVKLPEDLSVPFAFEVATEQLEPGEHKFCVRAKGTDGIWTYLNNKTFTVFIGKAGDANSDGHVTVADAEAVAAHIMGQTPDNFNEKNANVNGDDKIDAADIVEIVNRIE